MEYELFTKRLSNLKEEKFEGQKGETHVLCVSSGPHCLGLKAGSVSGSAIGEGKLAVKPPSPLSDSSLVLPASLLCSPFTSRPSVVLSCSVTHLLGSIAEISVLNLSASSPPSERNNSN